MTTSSPNTQHLAVTLHEVCLRRVEAIAPADRRATGSGSGDSLSARIAEIVKRNIASGRAQRVSGISPSLQIKRADPTGLQLLESYVDRVIRCYLKEHERVEKLASGDDAAAWTQLREQLRPSAFYMLLRLRFPAARADADAEDFAHLACESIYRHPFPYDVSFDAWSLRILKNLILHACQRSRELTDRDPALPSLDAPLPGQEDDSLSWHEVVPDNRSAAEFETVELQDRLLRAIERLDDRSQQFVIIATYFDGLKDEEIAQRLGKSRQAIYNLRHRALHRLRAFLKSERIRSESALEKSDSSKREAP